MSHTKFQTSLNCKTDFSVREWSLYSIVFYDKPISGKCSRFIHPENTTKSKIFRCFFKGIRWEQWPEMLSF